MLVALCTVSQRAGAAMGMGGCKFNYFLKDLPSEKKILNLVRDMENPNKISATHESISRSFQNYILFKKNEEKVSINSSWEVTCTFSDH